MTGFLPFTDDRRSGKTPTGTIGIRPFRSPGCCRHDSDCVRVDVLPELFFMPPGDLTPVLVPDHGLSFAYPFSIVRHKLRTIKGGNRLKRNGSHGVKVRFDFFQMSWKVSRIISGQ
jgi:hypothetical protein